MCIRRHWISPDLFIESKGGSKGIDKNYVPLACTKEELDPDSKRPIGVSRYTEEDGWIEGYIDRWLDDPAKEHISILGEFGTGKTWFALHYAWTALKRYQDAQHRGVQLPRLPLVISLRDYAKAVSVESLFSEFFFRQHEIPMPGYSAFEQLNRMGKLLLIFDGFDEMAAKCDRQQMINNFWELAKVVVPGAKVIFTCRTEHFPEAREGRALLKGELKASTANLTGETPQFEVLELEKFNNEQIRKVLSLQTETTTVEQVMHNSQLLDLARRPVMSDLILEALPEIEAGKPVSQTTYSYHGGEFVRYKARDGSAYWIENASDGSTFRFEETKNDGTYYYAFGRSFITLKIPMKGGASYFSDTNGQYWNTNHYVTITVDQKLGDDLTGDIKVSNPVNKAEVMQDCQPVQKLGPTAPNEAVEITFVNHTSREVRLFWISHDQQPIQYHILRPDERFLQPTYTNHWWMAKSMSGECLGVFKSTDARPAVVDIEPKVATIRMYTADEAVIKKN